MSKTWNKGILFVIKSFVSFKFVSIDLLLSTGHVSIHLKFLLVLQLLIKHFSILSLLYSLAHMQVQINILILLILHLCLLLVIIINIFIIANLILFIQLLFNITLVRVHCLLSPACLKLFWLVVFFGSYLYISVLFFSLSLVFVDFHLLDSLEIILFNVSARLYNLHLFFQLQAMTTSYLFKTLVIIMQISKLLLMQFKILFIVHWIQKLLFQLLFLNLFSFFIRFLILLKIIDVFLNNFLINVFDLLSYLFTILLLKVDRFLMLFKCIFLSI